MPRVATLEVVGAWRVPNPKNDVMPPAPPDDEVSTVDWKRRWNARTQPRCVPASTCVQAPWRARTFTGASAASGATVRASADGRSLRSVARLVAAASWAKASPISDRPATSSGRKRRRNMAAMIGRAGATFN